VPAVDHPQLSAEPARVDVAGIYLVIRPLLAVEITKDRRGAPAALRRRAFCGIAAGSIIAQIPS
jgi:hypothetical protein